MAEWDPTRYSGDCNDRFPVSPGLMALLNHSDEPCGIQDRRGRYRHVNAALRTLLALPDDFVITGHTDGELPHPVAEYAMTFQAQHGWVREQRKVLRVLNIFPFGKYALMEPYLYEIYPFFNDAGQCMGTLFHAWPCLFFSPLACLEGQVPQPYHFHSQRWGFSARELEVMFFALQGLSSQEIAHQLNLSYRTVNNRLLQLYRKTDVNSLRQFRHYCQREGLDRFVPARFFAHGQSGDRKMCGIGKGVIAVLCL